MGMWNPRAICPNCGGKIHTQTGLFWLGQVSGNRCQHCGAALTGKVGMLTNQAQLVPSEGERQKIEEKERADFEAAHAGAFDVVATVPAGVLTALRERKKRKELQERLGLTKSEVSMTQRLIEDWKVEPDGPSVVAAAVGEDSATETKGLMEKLGAQVELVPASYKTTEPPTDEDSQAPQKPGSSPEASEDPLAKIEKLGQLHDTGVLTDEEFQTKKAELLGRL